MRQLTCQAPCVPLTMLPGPGGRRSAGIGVLASCAGVTPMGPRTGDGERNKKGGGVPGADNEE